MELIPITSSVTSTLGAKESRQETASSAGRPGSDHAPKVQELQQSQEWVDDQSGTSQAGDPRSFCRWVIP